MMIDIKTFEVDGLWSYRVVRDGKTVAASSGFNTRLKARSFALAKAHDFMTSGENMTLDNIPCS